MIRRAARASSPSPTACARSRCCRDSVLRGDAVSCHDHVSQRQDGSVLCAPVDPVLEPGESVLECLAPGPADLEADVGRAARRITVEAARGARLYLRRAEVAAQAAVRRAAAGQAIGIELPGSRLE